jgi:hypothetical protein
MDGQLGAGGSDAPEVVGLFGGFEVEVVLADDGLGVAGLERSVGFQTQ